MKIYGANVSPFVRKVLAVCAIKGIEFEHDPVPPGGSTPEYLAMSPLGKIPALHDGDLKISDSSVICEYLEEKYPEIPTMPKSPEDRARARWLEEYGDSRLAESLAVLFFERIVKKLLGRGDPDEARLDKMITEEIPKCLDYLESIVPEEGFFFGAICTADIALFNPFVNGGYGGYEMDSTAYPKTAAFIARVGAHPSIAPLLEAEKEMLASLKKMSQA